MNNFTFEETNLLCIYNTGSRTGLIAALTEMRGELSPEEAELRELTDSALGKLQAMNDTEFAELELYPDFDEYKTHIKTGWDGLICRPISIQHEGRTENHAIQS